jgi:hypothetical protein
LLARGGKRNGGSLKEQEGPNDEVRTGDKVREASAEGSAIGDDGTVSPTRIHLASGAPGDFPDALEAVLGAAISEEVKDRVSRVRERESDVLSWLSSDNRHLDKFVQDPVGTLRKQFPSTRVERSR